MKILTKYIGKIIEFNPPPEESYVLLKELNNNNTIKANIISEKLEELNITHPDSEFEVIIFEDENKKISGKIVPITNNEQIIVDNNPNINIINTDNNNLQKPEQQKEYIEKLESRIKELEKMLGIKSS